MPELINYLQADKPDGPLPPIALPVGREMTQDERDRFDELQWFMTYPPLDTSIADL